MENTNGSEPIHDSQSSNGIQGITSKAEEKVRVLSESARTEAGQRMHKIGGVAQERLDSQRERVAIRIEETAAKLRERGDNAGTIGHTAGEQVASRMEVAAGYLQQHHTEEIAGDVATYVKQHPVRSMVAAAVLGYLVGRVAA